MSLDLDELAFKLNNVTTQEGTTFEAIRRDDDILEVTCSNNDEFPICVTQTESQILTITPLFSVKEVASERLAELQDLLLSTSPLLPLSSLGKQSDEFILFGSMSLNTTFENIVHELEVQADNTIEVLEVIEPLLV